MPIHKDREGFAGENFCLALLLDQLPLDIYTTARCTYDAAYRCNDGSGEKLIMIEPDSYAQLKHDIAERIAADRVLLDQLRAEIRPLRSAVRRIYPRTTTSISLVATDGGNNSLRFDPFLVQVVRVVDSSNNEYCLEAITPSTSISGLGKKQFNADGSPQTALGEMMRYLGVSTLQELSHMIRENEDGHPTSSSWVQNYRELVEWAILFSLVRKKDFGTDILIVYDGLLRSKVFTGDLFKKYLQGIQESIELQKYRNHRKIYLAGVAKQSKVLSRYRLAMALEDILLTRYPAYVPIPRDVEERAYIRVDYAHGDDWEIENRGVNRFVGGNMFFVKFGSGPHDPIWPVDIFSPQVPEVATILGYMLADAINGFPVPLYPRCLQKAHANATLAEFDFDILQDHIFAGIRQILAEEASVLDVFRLKDVDLAQRRYEA